MKKVVNGLLYDTVTAALIGEYSSGGSCRDFSHFEESLYKTPNGAYFIAGSGGPMTSYCRAVGQNEWTGGEDLRPLSREDALEWAEEHLAAVDVMAEFGDMVQTA